MGVGRPAVLVVDDSKDEREMWTEFLRQQGFHPVMAATSEEALRLAAASPPDVVVVDLVLPGSMNGLELTHRLKQGLATKRVPVVMLTGAARPQDRLLAVSAGVDVFLTKPCAPGDLLRVIRSLTDDASSKRRAGQEPDAPASTP